jgi:hypothetical protein
VSVLLILRKCIALGLFAGFLLSLGAGLESELWALVGLLLFVGGLMAIYEISVMQPDRAGRLTSSDRGETDEF